MIRALLTVVALASLVPVARAQDRLKFEQKRNEVLFELGDRHLDLGLWCRDRGLTTQAAAEFVYAVEISEGKHYGAGNVLRVMRTYDDEFWKKYKRGTEANRKSYEIKAAKARERDAKDLLDFADWAWNKTFEKDALEIYVALVRDSGDELVFDGKGRLVTEHGTVRAEAASYIREKAVEIDGKLYADDEFLGALPKMESAPLREASSEILRVRGPIDVARLEQLRAMGLALMPRLEEAIQARPARRLDVFVFPDRASYDAWLSTEGFAGWALTAGLADPRTSTAVVCAEGKTDGEVEALLLHELTHLYWYASTPTAMPDWFGEGLAETFGGQGTFVWDGETLSLGGIMADFRLAELRAGTELFPLEQMLTTRAVDLWSQSPERALVFYAQAWAFQRYLRSGAPAELRERYERWVAMCAGSAAGGDSVRARHRDATQASELFQKEFGSELGALESGFRAWLKEL